MLLEDNPSHVFSLMNVALKTHNFDKDEQDLFIEAFHAELDQDGDERNA